MNANTDFPLFPAKNVNCGVIFHDNGSFQFFDTKGGSHTYCANDNGSSDNARRMRAIATILAIPTVLDMVLTIADELDIPAIC